MTQKYLVISFILFTFAHCKHCYYITSNFYNIHYIIYIRQ